MKFEWAIFCQMCKLVSSGQQTVIIWKSRICHGTPLPTVLPFCPPSHNPRRRRRRHRRRGRWHWRRRSASVRPSWPSSPSTTASANCSPSSEYLWHFWSTQISWFVYKGGIFDAGFGEILSSPHLQWAGKRKFATWFTKLSVADPTLVRVSCVNLIFGETCKHSKSNETQGCRHLWARKYAMKLSPFRGNQIKCQSFSNILPDQNGKFSPCIWPWGKWKENCQPLPRFQTKLPFQKGNGIKLWN